MEAGIYKALFTFPNREVYLLICEDREDPNYTRVFAEKKDKRNVKPNGQWDFSGKIEDYFLFPLTELRESDLKFSRLEKIASLSDLDHKFIEEYRIRIQ